MDARDLLVEMLGKAVDPRCRNWSFLVHSSIWAITWLEKLLLITKDGWPVALPRFSKRPSESTMIE